MYKDAASIVAKLFYGCCKKKSILEWETTALIDNKYFP